ncbi:uncharacterized protein LOC117597613 isoform X2 [Pangasianodon hypophthalmus]|uniref:uncharacterized protein LOC117597613 isoform X2 n=1 Tax=Pangasianodon hypophthalmus TaxID=310915 RepID=UPI00147AE890|nr:uncharacterized protein LOC117597613 isoform X2 [Pangasianodon hypophthalmus]
MRQDIYNNASMIQQDPLQAIENAILCLNRHDDPFLEIEAAIRSISTEEEERGQHGEGVEGGVEGEGEGIEEEVPDGGVVGEAVEVPEGGVVGEGVELGGGGGGVGSGADSEETQAGGGGGEREINVTTHENFNTVKMRRMLTIPPPGDEPDIATFYQNVIGLIRELVDDARAVAGRRDLVQLSVEGENVRVHASVVADGTGENILPVFEDMLDRLVQSNTWVAANKRVDLIVQVVRNPRGGGKRKLEKTLDCEIIRKKRRHLYVTEDRGDQLCFAISLAHVCNGSFTDRQCERQARE